MTNSIMLLYFKIYLAVRHLSESIQPPHINCITIIVYVIRKKSIPNTFQHFKEIMLRKFMLYDAQYCTWLGWKLLGMYLQPEQVLQHMWVEHKKQIKRIHSQHHLYKNLTSKNTPLIFLCIFVC